MGKKYIQPVRGTRDYVGEEMRLFRHIVETARETAERFNFREMQTPVFEFSEVFHRSLGDTSDVVSKETYTFDDRGGESITLRPEFTAAIVRAFISGGYTQQLPFKAFYAGPAFRYERPQKGRLRQFHQVGVECLGASEPWQDVETIHTAYVFLLEACNVLLDVIFNKAKLPIILELNTLGDEESRLRYRDALITYLQRYKHDLSEESQIRLEKNPLRILDSKQVEDQEIISDAPSLHDHLSPVSQNWFEAVCAGLEKLNIPYRTSERLVRGLDYYSHTVFEFTSDKLGSQATVLAGGRYDKLVEHLGGPSLAGVGWAAGIERLMLLLENNHVKVDQEMFVVGGMNDDYMGTALALANIIRFNGFRAEITKASNVSKALKKANNLKATHFIAVGEREHKNSIFRVKNLLNGVESESYPILEAFDKFQSIIDNIK